VAFTTVELGTLAVLASYGFTGLVAPLFGPRAARFSLYVASIATLMAALYATLRVAPAGGYVTAFNGSIVVDTFTVYMLSTAALVFALAAAATGRIVEYWESGEAFYAVIGLMAMGVIVLGLSRALYLVYIAWILAAVSSYVLVALYRDSVSAEAAMKYAVAGAVATIILLLDIVLYSLAKGGLNVSPRVATADPLLLTPVVTLAIVAVGFKMGVVPFHGWLVDVYGNARPLVIAVASAAAKVIAALLTVKLVAPFAAAAPHVVLWSAGLLAALTMLYGNLGALLTVRDSPQKLLAYSSIAQAGYILAGVAALAKLPGVDNNAAVAGIALHTSGYALAKLAAFLGLEKGCSYPCRGWDRVRGLAVRNPAAAAAMLLALASLAGMPPTLGFWGKLYILQAAVSASTPLAALLAANFVLGAFYYGYMIYMLFQPPGRGPVLRERPGLLEAAALAAALLTLLLGLAPGQAYGLTVYAYNTG